MWEKFKAQVTARPYLFGGVALAVLLWIFWPRGASQSGDDGGAAAANAMAQTAAANAALQLAHEETQRVGLLANAQLQISANDNDTAVALNAATLAAETEAARIAAGALQFEQTTALELAKVAASGQANQLSTMLQSQEKAQSWASKMLAEDDILPGNFQTFGFSMNGPAIVKVPPPPPVASPIYNPLAPAGGVMLSSYVGGNNDRYGFSNPYGYQ